MSIIEKKKKQNKKSTDIVTSYPLHTPGESFFAM